jgi:hypothetical protein
MKYGPFRISQNQGILSGTEVKMKTKRSEKKGPREGGEME